MSLNKDTPEESAPVDSRLYREIVGSLVYIMTSTRPDLCYKTFTVFVSPNSGSPEHSKACLKVSKRYRR